MGPLAPTLVVLALAVVLLLIYASVWTDVLWCGSWDSSGVGTGLGTQAALFVWWLLMASGCWRASSSRA